MPDLAVNRYEPPVPPTPPPPSHGPFHSPDWSPSPQPPYPPGYPQTPQPGFYPLTVGRGLSMAFSMYRFGWKTFVPIALIVFIPVAIVQGVLQSIVYASIADWQRAITGSPFGPRPDPQAALAATPFAAFGLILVAALVAGVFSTIGGAALIHAVGAALRGERLSVRGAYSAAFARLPSLLALYLILTIGGFAGAFFGYVLPLFGVISAAMGVNGGLVALLGLIVMVALIFALAFVLIRLAFAMQTLMIEGVPAVEALRRSWFLLAGSMLRFVGWILLFALIVGLLALLIELPFLLLSLIISPPRFADIASGAPNFGVTLAITQVTLGTLVGGILAPLITIGTTLLYFEIRWRHGERVPVPGQPG